jgi:hypothetical protein
LKVPKDPYQYAIYDNIKGQTNPFLDQPEDVLVSLLPKLPLTLEHLKKYRNIYRLWHKASAKLDELNSRNYSSDECKDELFDEVYDMLKQLRERLQKLVRDIDAGATLKGKCSITY